MTVNPALFWGIPLIAVLCNLFLFLTLLTAQKSKLLYSFMGMLAAFILWSGGALFMRLSFFPGVNFWWDVSIVGVASVPLAIYLFMFYYTNQKGNTVRNIWIAVSAVMIVLAGLDVFAGHPVLTVVGGEKMFTYETHWTAAIALIYAAAILLSTIPMIRRSLKTGSILTSQVTPLIVGAAFIFAGVVLDMVPSFSTLPIDSLGCMANSICIYYALYRKRLFRLTQLNSRGPTYLIAAVISGVLIFTLNEELNGFFSLGMPGLGNYEALVIAAFFFLLSTGIFAILNALGKRLFVQKQQQQENLVREFSMAVNRTLKLSEVVSAYCELLRVSFPGENAFVCLYDEPSAAYRMTYSVEPIQRREFSIPKDNPLVGWLEEHRAAIRYSDFQRTSTYRSMWEKEKALLAELKISLILPIGSDGKITGFTLFPERYRKKPYGSGEISFLESAVSVLSIALNNAVLYETIGREARMDSLTELYNRRSFTAELKKLFEQAKGDTLSVIMFNLDDFKLYNELYGSDGGDRMLCCFADILRRAFAGVGTAARYGGKEFAVALPFCDSAAAARYASGIQTALQEALAQDNEKIHRFLTFSAGICTYPTAASTEEQLLSYANMAVYTAKKQGKNRIVTYSRTGGQAGGEKTMQSKLTIGQEYMPTIYALTAAIDAKDHYTFNHSQNVSSLATQLGQLYGLDEEHLEIIRQAGLLHDIGKIGIPDAILSKPARLNAEEYAVIKQHVERSIAMIRHLPSLDYVIPVVIAHHERYDGKGYPRGLKGEEIPIGARCMAIADSFDAMVSRRSYKDQMPVDKALEEIERNLGTQFDPNLGRLFVENIRAGKITFAA